MFRCKREDDMRAVVKKFIQPVSRHSPKAGGCGCVVKIVNMGPNDLSSNPDLDSLVLPLFSKKINVLFNILPKCNSINNFFK